MDCKFTIVVAEDDANDRKLLHLALQRNLKPVEIHELTDGIETVEYLKGEGRFKDRIKFPLPDLLIVDLKMPRMDGLQVIDWVRKEPQLARLPIVMLSGSGLDQDVAEAYRLGVNSYIRKPEDFNDFVHKLGVLIDYWMMTESPNTDRIR